MGKNEIMGYEPLVNNLKQMIQQKQYRVLQMVNSETINLYWKIGEEIYRQQEEKGWGKSIVQVLSKELQKEFYMQMVKLNQTNFDLTLPEERRMQAKLAIKDEYTFDFAELSPEYSEHELEMQLVNNIRAFLIEMGGDFAFIGNQYHLVAGSKDIYIDMLLFHRRLRSLIAIELKIGEFEAEYAGKMQLYLTVLNEQEKLPDENPSIGIIICKSKDKTYVEYALKRTNAPIGVATY